jgi:hypothetical protein
VTDAGTGAGDLDDAMASIEVRFQDGSEDEVDRWSFDGGDENAGRLGCSDFFAQTGPEADSPGFSTFRKGAENVPTGT